MIRKDLYDALYAENLFENKLSPSSEESIKLKIIQILSDYTNLWFREE